MTAAAPNAARPRGLLFRYAVAQLRFLGFQHAAVAATDRQAFLGLALVATWIAGLGRYWDHPQPFWFQSLGLGSVAYVFVFTLLLWLFGLPLKPRAWRYRDVLLFVAMTSPLAWLYAVPVERFLSLATARAMNAMFLGVVALWRATLLIRHLSIVGGLGPVAAISTALLPLTGIVVALTMLNLEQATFDLMATGTRGTSRDGAYEVVILLSIASTFLFFPLLGAWAISIHRRHCAPAAAEARAKEPPQS